VNSGNNSPQTKTPGTLRPLAFPYEDLAVLIGCCVLRPCLLVDPPTCAGLPTFWTLPFELQPPARTGCRAVGPCLAAVPRLASASGPRALPSSNLNLRLSPARCILSLAFRLANGLRRRPTLPLCLQTSASGLHRLPQLSSLAFLPALRLASATGPPALPWNSTSNSHLRPALRRSLQPAIRLSSTCCLPARHH
jgi:hypothetical protein